MQHSLLNLGRYFWSYFCARIERETILVWCQEVELVRHIC